MSDEVVMPDEEVVISNIFVSHSILFKHKTLDDETILQWTDNTITLKRRVPIKDINGKELGRLPKQIIGTACSHAGRFNLEDFPALLEASTRLHNKKKMFMTKDLVELTNEIIEDK